MSVDDETAFEQTQHIGSAIHALAEAELAVAAVEDLRPDAADRLDRIMRDVQSRLDD